MNNQKITLLITFFFLLISAGCGQDNQDKDEIVAPILTEEVKEAIDENITEDIDDSKAATDEMATDEATPSAPTIAPPAEAEPEIADPNPQTVLISHILAGIQGNNNYDYIALYNNSGSEVDLNGYTLTYQARPDAELQTLIAWDEKTPLTRGHYLLGRQGEIFAKPVDATFDQQIFNRGSLVLTDGNQQVVDIVGWGDMPAGSYSGSPAAKLPRGMTLVRQTDPPFASESTANIDLFTPQADPPIPGCPIENAQVQLIIDPSVSPGSEFSIEIKIDDPSVVESLSLLIPAGFALLDTDPFPEATRYELETPLAKSQSLQLIAPITLQPIILRGGSAVIYGHASCIPATHFTVEGILPIRLARTFIDQTVTVEGVATMYTDGFFAGSTGTKFYIEDETGGVQIFVPGGKSGVSIKIGDRVRVTGKTELYRSALEVIPADFEADIEVIEKAADNLQNPQAADADLASPAAEESVGKLLQVAGTIGRIEEFNFSYEIDLIDESGNNLLVYIDKLTEISVEAFDVGQSILISGIFDSWDSQLRLNPRVQTDLARIWPEQLVIDVNAPAAVSAQPIDYKISITNHTSQVQTNILVTAPRPEGSIETVIIDTGVTATREIVNWLIPEMEPGESIVLNMTVNLLESATHADQPLADRVFFFPVSVTSDQLSANDEPLLSKGIAVYTGGILPIWAIQGSGEKSAYTGRTETTSGIITGIFPDLDGFFIQSQTNDKNISTSNGLFVRVTDGDIPEGISAGIQVNVTGKISENSGQTEIQIEGADAITIISTTNLLETIAPVPLIPPTQGGQLGYFEAREGMLVTLDGYAVAVGPGNRFGEFPLYPVSQSENLDPNAPLIYRDPAASTADGIIFVDDGSNAEYEHEGELPLSIVTGDIVLNVTGPLAYTYGNYKIEPLNTADIIVEPSTYADRTVEIFEPSSPSEVAIASFNVENLFDPFDPHPSSPALPSLETYRQKLAKLSAAFKQMGYPEIVALQEVENLKVLEDLAETITAEGGPTYQAHLIEGSDSRGIDVAYMTTERVNMIALEQRPAPEGVTSREPLLMLAQVQVNNSDQTFVLINNHFTSLAGGEEATLPRRTAQAEWNAGLIAEISKSQPAAHIVVLGDLNSFRATPPLDALESELHHIYDKIDQDGIETPYPPYTYIFEGVAQSLDHILVSDQLFDALTTIVALPINADYSLAAEEDITSYRSSDHNPLIAVFEFEAE